MTRITFFFLLLSLFFAACTSSDDRLVVADKGVSRSFVSSQHIDCRVLDFFFCDVSSDIIKHMVIGPFRLHGIAEECTCTMLLPPFCTPANNFLNYLGDSYVSASVAMYSDKIGFFKEYSPCWRLRVVTAADVDVGNLFLEVNYSYNFDDKGNVGFVQAMQRIPITVTTVSSYGVEHNIPEILFYGCSCDDSLPFSIVCLCFPLSNREFYPL